MGIQLRIPDNIKVLDKKTLIGLSPTEKEKYYDRIIADILVSNPYGVSALEVEKATGFYGRTVREHLQSLVKIGKAYDVTRSGIAFYFPSGKPEEKELVITSKSRDGVFYVLNKISSQRGKFYYLQQKELDDYHTLTVKGGILIAEEDAKDFIYGMHTYCAGTKKDE